MKYVGLFLILVNVAVAQNVFTSVDTTSVEIGQQIEYNLRIVSKAKDQVKYMVPTDSLGKFLIVDKKLDSINERGLITRNYTYTLAYFDTLNTYIPSEVVYINQETYKTQEIPIKYIPIVSTEKDLTKQPDIYRVEYPWWERLRDWAWQNKYWILGEILLIIAFFVVRRYYKPSSKDETQPIEPEIDFEDWLPQQIQLLKDAQYLQKGQVKEYYSRLTYLSRRFIKYAYGINAMELSTSELLASLKSKVSMEEWMSWKELFNEGDLSKYAKHIPNDDFNKHSITILEKYSSQYFEEKKKREELEKEEEI